MAVEIPTVQEMQDRAITEVQTRNPRLTDTYRAGFGTVAEHSVVAVAVVDAGDADVAGPTPATSRPAPC